MFLNRTNPAESCAFLAKLAASHCLLLATLSPLIGKLLPSLANAPFPVEGSDGLWVRVLVYA